MIWWLRKAYLNKTFEDRVFKMERILETQASEFPCVTDSMVPSSIRSGQ